MILVVNDVTNGWVVQMAARLMHSGNYNHSSIFLDILMREAAEILFQVVALHRIIKAENLVKGRNLL